MFTVPMAHFRGIPTALRERFGIPVLFYDGDVPMSLPEYGGMDTGFNPYHGADPSEYDLVLSNSEGGIERLLELGARRGEALFWAADPEFFSPQPVEKEIDVFFYGYGDKFRRDWMQTMVGEPSRIAPDLDIALGGLDFQGDVGTARLLGDIPFNVFARAISTARVNLNMTRRPHATVPASSTARPFELASSGAAIVSNPHEGIERWFEPGSELVLIDSAEEAVAAYRELVVGSRARRRRWVVARGSACSTSTRTPIAPADCSSSSASESRRSHEPGAGAQGRRDRPRLERGRGDRPGRRRDPRRRSDDRRRRRRRRLDGRRPPRSRQSTARRSSALPFNVGIGGAVQTGLPVRARRGLRRRGPARRGRPARPVRAREAARADRARRGEPRHRLALRGRHGLLPAAVRAPHGDPRLRAARLAARRPARDGYDLRLRRARPARDRALRRGVPARLPGGRGDARRRCAAASRLAQVQVEMRERETGSSSIRFVRRSTTWSRSSLALLVASVRRYPRLQEARR